MNELKMSNIVNLSVAERIMLIELIWESISAYPDALPLSEEQSKELDKRLEDYERNPGGNVNWEQAKKMILSKR